MHRLSWILLALLLLAGCRDVVKEIDTPGPPPPYNPKGAALPSGALPHKSEPSKPADEPAADEPNSAAEPQSPAAALPPDEAEK